MSSQGTSTRKIKRRSKRVEEKEKTRRGGMSREAATVSVSLAVSQLVVVRSEIEAISKYTAAETRHHAKPVQLHRQHIDLKKEGTPILSRHPPFQDSSALRGCEILHFLIFALQFLISCVFAVFQSVMQQQQYYFCITFSCFVYFESLL